MNEGVNLERILEGSRFAAGSLLKQQDNTRNSVECDRFTPKVTL